MPSEVKYLMYGNSLWQTTDQNHITKYVGEGRIGKDMGGGTGKQFKIVIAAVLQLIIKTGGIIEWKSIKLQFWVPVQWAWG